MAIYHLHAGVISRATSPRTTCAASAYIGGLRIVCGRDGRTHDYTHRRDVVAGGVVLPDGAPAGLSDPSALWNEIETSVERSGRAQLAREMDAAIPVELGRDARVALARGYAESLSREYGVPVQWAVHDKRGGNPHMHLLAPLHAIDPDTGRWLPKSVNAYLVRDGDGNEREATAAELKELGPGWQKVYRYRGAGQLTKGEAKSAGLHPTRDRTSKSPVQATRYLSEWSGNWGDGYGKGAALVRWRERWAVACNDALERAGSDERIDHRSNKARGIELLPTLHEGPAVTALERRAEREARDRGREYVPVTEVRRENLRRKRINEMLREVIRMLTELMRTRLERARTLGQKRAAQRAATRRRPRAKRPYAPQRGRRTSPRGGYGR